ncbi:unnamed protein product, partial [Prorocentrum cordatum]
MLLLLLLLGREVKCINSTPHLGAQRPTTQETVRPVFRQDLARPFLLLLHRRETAAAALAEPTALAAAAAAAPAASGTSGPSRRCRPPPRDCRCRAGRADGGGGRRRCTASLWPSRRPRLPCRARPRPTAELAAAAAVKRAHAVKRASAWPTARGPLAEGAALADGCEVSGSWFSGVCVGSRWPSSLGVPSVAAPRRWRLRGVPRLSRAAAGEQRRRLCTYTG